MTTIIMFKATAAESRAMQGNGKGVADERRRARAELNELTQELKQLRADFTQAGASLEEFKQVTPFIPNEFLKIRSIAF